MKSSPTAVSGRTWFTGIGSFFRFTWMDRLPISFILESIEELFRTSKLRSKTRSRFARPFLTVLEERLAPDASSTNLTLGTFSSVWSQNVNVSVSVSPQSGFGPTPTGSVTITNLPGSFTLSGGSVGYNTTSLTTALAIGTYYFDSTYSGDGTYSGSATTFSQMLTIGTASTTTTSWAASATSSPPTYGAGVYLYASVTGQSGTTKNPTGTVEFDYGSTVLGTATLDSSGNAQLLTYALPPGSDSISCTYSGDAHFSSSYSSGSVSLNQSNTVVAAGSTAVGLAAGQTFTLWATVAPPPGTYPPALPTGSVAFWDGGTYLGSGAGPSSTYTAGYTLPNGLGSGSHTISAVYTGDTNYVYGGTASVVLAFTDPSTAIPGFDSNCGCPNQPGSLAASLQAYIQAWIGAGWTLCPLSRNPCRFDP